mgnify:CR=1 FL=1|tara:strand:+ start:1620 stop:2777 length:1158 start_codon:yes stop_codon:yes gene_type:complete
MNKKILISGIGQSDGGVGRLMKRLEPVATARGYSILSRRMIPLLPMIRNKKYLTLFFELFLKFFSWFVFKFKTLFVRGDTILVLHPQSIGYKTFMRLVKTNTVYLYVMDNSFFCMMSYNYDKFNGSECLRCVSNPRNSFSECYSWPPLIRKKVAINYLEELMLYSESIVFLAQTRSQEKLLVEHFGNNIDCRVVGMEPVDLSFADIQSIDLTDISRDYDLVYHGSVHPAKGIIFFLQVSLLLPRLKIFIPMSLSAASSIFSDCKRLNNVTFQDCTWETGLENAVRKAKLVVNPSLWSAPIEGAFLKSLAYNGNVAVVNSKFGYSSENTFQNIVLKLPEDPSSAADLLKNYIDNSVDNGLKTKECLSNFYSSNKTDNVFDAVDLIM